MNDPIYITRSDMPPIEEYFHEIAPLWESRRLTNNGILHERFQKELQKYLQVENVGLFCNGHIALSSIIRTMNLSGEIITTPFTFVSTTHAITENGIEPVFCDIKPNNCTIDPKKIEELITEKTSAILAVHVYGNLCDIEAIDKIAKKHNLKVIYDAAHAIGVTKKGIGAGCFGDASMFSFHATKLFHSIEGGCVTFSDKSLIEPLERIKNFGIYRGGEEDIEYGSNGKMNEFSSAMGLCNLRRINQVIEKRANVYWQYQKLLGGIEGVKIALDLTEANHNFAYFPVLFDKEKLGFGRDDVLKELRNDNIYARRYFYPLIPDFPYYKNRFNYTVPTAKDIADNILCLPMYADLSPEDINRICKVIIRMFGKSF